MNYVELRSDTMTQPPSAMRQAMSKADAENLPFESNSIDCLTISYGFRNISNYEKALEEFYRVLKPGGKLGILEFSKPASKIIGFIFRLYFHHILLTLFLNYGERNLW